MIGIVGSCLVLGIGLCVFARLLANSTNPASSAFPLFALPGIVLIVAAIVLAIGNVAVQALL